ncbi:MAG TPA: alpha/beta fold hydrolase, partial [Kofleriaceae bacterium]|nr:alpha/beta fold hydrolase [Kofleriaceae bacterium]
MPAPAPIYFGDAGARLFGWVHQPGQHARPTAVVLCNPLGDDYVRAHRSLRHLAEDLCAAGFPVLRFDFHGTGDSAGNERDPGRLAAWRRDLGTAIDELRRQSGAAKVAVVGLRLGATIAAEVASQRDDVASVVLWHPFIDGSSFTSETLRMHRMHRMLEPKSFAAGPTEYADGEEALGFFLTKETIADLERVDLMTLPRRPAPHVLVIGAANVPAEGPLQERLRALGAEVTYRHLPGHKFLISIPHRSTVPQDVIDAIVGWLADTHSTLDATAPRSVPRPDRHEASQFVEEPLVFGTTHRLFGILVKPVRDRARSDLPAIIMINAGTVHRIGPHRLYVELARELAELGFHVLRMDLSGIGDSPVASGDENLTYPATGLADCQAAMTALGERVGAQRFIFAGLCSGADITFQLGVKDDRVAGVVMMNPLTFCVQDPAFVEGYKGARYYQNTFFNKWSWLRLLRGEVDLVRVAKMLAPKVKGLAARVVDRVRPITNGGDDHADVPAYLRMMAERGIDTFLVVTEHDPGVDYVDVHFG